MPFSLQPNPRLYAKLAAQWEAEETQRQDEAAARSYFTTQRNRFLILFVIAILLLQISVFLYKTYTSPSRQARRQLYVQHGKDVEDVVTVEWSEAEKLPVEVEDESSTKLKQNLQTSTRI